MEVMGLMLGELLPLRSASLSLLYSQRSPPHPQVNSWTTTRCR